MPGCTDLPGTYLKIYLLFMTVSAIVMANSLCFAGEAEDRAAASAAPVLDLWATPEGFYENLSRPLMSGDTPLYTLDGSDSATSRSNCGPTAGTGWCSMPRTRPSWTPSWPMSVAGRSCLFPP